MEGRGNSMGARHAGLLPRAGGLNALQVLDQAAKSGWDLLYVAGADPARQLPAKSWKEAREKLGFLVVQDLFLTDTAKQADVVLPTLSFVEKEGSFINIEGRVQNLKPGKAIPENLLSDGDIFRRLAHKLQLSFEEFASLAQGSFVRPARTFANTTTPASTISAHELAGTFAPALFDHGTRMRHNPHVIQLAKEPKLRIHPSEGEKRTLKTGDLVRASTNGNAITAKIKLDARIAPGTIVIPLGFEKIPARDLSPHLQNGFPVHIERVS
jgi:NADH-quinone oxidoreductase subunit G